VAGQDDDDVGPLQQRVELGALVHVAALVAEAGNVGVVVPDARAAGRKPGDDRSGGRVAIVLDIRLEGDADDPHARALERELTLVEPVCDEVDDVAGHREVDVGGKLDEAVEEVE
jgi:hypothetical protein